MSSDLQLPCETLEGPCLICHVTPENHEVLLCDGCGSGWHMQCLKPPLDKVPDYAWTCPDCEPDVTTTGSRVPMEKDSIIARVRAVQADSSLTDSEKARRIMDIHCPPMAKSDDEKNDVGSVKEGRAQVNKTIKMLNENLKCMICLDIVNRPVTTPCGHNSCLKCFEKTVQQRNNNCPQCRAPIPHSMRMQPRINSTLVTALRLAAISAKSSTVTSKFQGPPKVQHHVIENAKRPDTFFTSERAVKTGKANAASGKVFVNVSRDHFGPIPAAADPRGTGVLVGENWADRLDCRQWGTHMPHVAGIAGQAEIGAQSVCLSGGYVDDEDHGEWFLYTGSGGRDLSGNKRTNKNQSFDQKFLKSNEALRVSCREGYPVRVVRSHKEKRSSYAPGEKCVRYDGVYRIEACWRKIGIQGYRVCRYLFVRCDNEPAPWSSEENGDRPRPLPPVAEMNSASDVTVRKTQAAWDWKAEEQAWGWTKDPPISRTDTGHPRKVASEKSNLKQERRLHIRMMREFGCVLCQKVMEQPLSTPCGHNFCKSCLLHKFAGSTDIRERKAVGGRSLRAQKVKKACPTCKGDITDFLCAPQVNRQLEDCIKGLLQEDKGEDDVSNPGETVKTDPVSSDEEGDELEEDNEEDSKIPAKSPQRALSSDVQLAEASPNTPLKVTSSGQFSKVAVTSPCEPSGNLVQEVAEDSRGSSVSGKGLLTSEASKHDKLKSPQDADLVVEDSEDDSRVPVQHRKRGRPEEAIAQEVVEDSEDDSPSPVKQRKRGRTREVTENQLATDSAVDVDKTVNTAKTSERDLPQESAPLTDLSNAPERDLRVEQETLAPKRRVRLSRALGKPNKAETSDLNASKTSATCPISLSDSDDDVFVPTRRMTRGFLTATTLKSSKSGLNASQSGLSPGKPIVLP